ncbi:MAG: hypothetical protein HY226_06010 [Candidatus Vogelbacteria bacterium]|nr:hypothetical protein [Candidatus Vogelbacteria bacterium]
MVMRTIALPCGLDEYLRKKAIHEDKTKGQVIRELIVKALVGIPLPDYVIKDLESDLECKGLLDIYLNK